MAFKKDEVAALLVACHRRCCVCHRFCGTKMEIHHIEQKDPPKDEIDNAIAVCFECHAEIASYNPDHPRGRRFTPDELRQHREQWLEICQTKPEALIAAQRDGDVGPLQALVDELEYNKTVAAHSPESERGALFLDTQFQRAIQEGMVAILEDDLRIAILEAYAAMSRANQAIAAESLQGFKESKMGYLSQQARAALEHAKPTVCSAYDFLIRFLRHDE